MDVIRRRGLRATMADGVELVADAWHPDGTGPWPVLLQRLPYGRAVASAPVLPHPVHLARRGYAVVVQDVRGRGDSDGRFDPFVHEAADGAATIEWASQLGFCDGQVATYGFSYQGVVQLAAARLAPSGLRAIAPMQCPADPFDGWTYEGGCLQWPFVTSWAAQLAGQEPGAIPPAVDLAALPTVAALGAAPPRWFAQWMEHPERDHYWAARSPAGSAVSALPAFCVAGYHDTFAAGSVRLIEALGAEAVLGPWGHMPWGSRLGPVELGPDAGPGTAHDGLVAFFDRVLRDRGDPPAERVRYYTGGVGWRAAPAWPPPSVLLQEWRATSGGRANSRHGDGRLVAGDADPGPSDVLASEPLVPVPGGLDPLSDESATEDRRDVLCFTSEPLGRDVVITGTATLSATTSADVASHDLVATLTMVAPDDRSVRLATGCRRLPPGPAEVERTSDISLSPVSWLVPQGHRLRLDLSASRFPAYDRNPQSSATAVWLATRADLRVAVIEVLDVRLVLPVEG